METIQGKKPFAITENEFFHRIVGYENVHLDLGTGDGRFTCHQARQNPQDFFIGIDACRENLRENSRNCPPNALYLIASAQSLPHELDFLAAEITINFPWGSLLRGLLEDDPALFNGLARVACPGAALTVRLNGGALSEAGWALDAGTWRVYENLLSNGYQVKSPYVMEVDDLRACPTTWAKRLAFGRDPRGCLIAARASLKLQPIKEARISESIFA
ncbi:MAG: class I SAM-dependent methyltransferase [Anaerolineales bacterium]